VRIERVKYCGESCIELSTRCTGAVGNRCKHAAALILAARRPGALVDKPRAEILAWARTLQERVAKADKARKPAPAKEGIFYICSVWMLGDGVEFSLIKSRVGPEGEPMASASVWSNYEQALLKPPSFVREEDLQVFRLLREASRRSGSYGRPELRGAEGLALLEAALATGRTYLELDDSGRITPLAAGAPRPGQLEWMPGEEGVKARVRVVPTAPLVICTEPLAYFDASRGEAGRVQMEGGAVLA